MTAPLRSARRELRQARAELAKISYSDPTWHTALARVLAGERSLAAVRGEEYAEVIDLGAVWDVGAPLPHVVASGLRAAVICRAAVHDPTWDGTAERIVSPSDAEEADLIRIDIAGYESVRIGAPNDEALHGHPLHGRGLVAYRAHEVHNSAWLEEHIRVNSVHSAHRDEAWRQLRHILLAFHDEMVEVLCREITAHLVKGTLSRVAADALDDIIGG
mgnify:CR=1 FL=1